MNQEPTPCCCFRTQLKWTFAKQNHLEIHGDYLVVLGTELAPGVLHPSDPLGNIKSVGNEKQELILIRTKTVSL